MRILKFLGFLVSLAIIAVGVMLFMGSRLPVAHTASVSAEVAAPQARVWQLIEDTDKQPSWRTGLLLIEAMPDRNGHHCWIEVQKHMRMPLCEDMAAAPAMRMVTIADPTLPFGGGWVYQLEPIGTSLTRVTITENGTTGPALWRFLGHYVFHEDTSIKQYEADLQRAVTM